MIPRSVKRYFALRSLARQTSEPALLEYAYRAFWPPRRTPIRDLRFVVFDTEATGLDQENDRMLSLAAVALKNGEIDLADRIELTFVADSVGGRAAAEIHQLVKSDVQDGLPEETGTLKFLTYLRDSVLVAHHVGFDVAMVNRVLARLGPVQLYNPTLDTLALHERLVRGPHTHEDPSRGESRSLDALCAKFGLDIPMRHSAAGDALATAQLLSALLAIARRRKIDTFGALMAR